MWSNLLLLLNKCHRPGCGAAVLSDNMKVIRNGIKQDYTQIEPCTECTDNFQGLQLKFFQLAMMDM